MLLRAPRDLRVAFLVGVDVVVDAVVDEDLEETEDVEVDEVADAVDSMTGDVVDREVAVELRPTVEVSETSKARSRLFKSRGIV